MSKTLSMLWIYWTAPTFVMSCDFEWAENIYTLFGVGVSNEIRFFVGKFCLNMIPITKHSLSVSEIVHVFAMFKRYMFKTNLSFRWIRNIFRDICNYHCHFVSSVRLLNACNRNQLNSSHVRNKQNPLQRVTHTHKTYSHTKIWTIHFVCLV